VTAEPSSDEQPKNEPTASEQPTGANQLVAPAPVIDDEHKYTTREAGDLLGLHPQTIISHIKRKNITAERHKETRGPVYYITGAEIKRFQCERRPRGYAGHRRVSKEKDQY
jgi:hypothetical protein